MISSYHSLSCNAQTCNHPPKYQASCNHTFCGWCIVNSTDSSESIFHCRARNPECRKTSNAFTDLFNGERVTLIQIRNNESEQAKSCKLIACYAGCCLAMLTLAALPILFKE